MNTERREPVISGLRPEKDEIARHQTRTAPSAAATQRAIQGARPIIVRSKLAPVAFVVALAGVAMAAIAYLDLVETRRLLAGAEARIAELESKFEVSDDESSASLEVGS